jgi:hypothetical protein
MESTNARICKRKHWEEVIRQWEASGRGIGAWCAEQQINYKTFLYWKTRIKASDLTRDPTESKYASFIELNDTPTVSSGIKVHHGNFTVSLSNDFTSSALLRCLQVMGQI